MSASPRSALKLLKLHGSVNWGVQSGETEFYIAPFLPRKSYAEVRANGEPVYLLPPTWRKKFEGGLDDVWDAAVTTISEATNIIIVGFSIPPTDTHFKYLLAAGLRDNISLRRILFVNSDENQQPLRARLNGVLRPDLFERGVVQMVPKTAQGFFFYETETVNRKHASTMRGINVGEKRS